MKKISVLIANRHATSISLEEEFYEILLHIAKKRKIAVSTLITRIDENRSTSCNLSSAIRVYILKHLLEQKEI